MSIGKAFHGIDAQHGISQCGVQFAKYRLSQSDGASFDDDAVAEKITREAEARAKALLAQAQAEAQAIKMKLEAEADGKKKSLLAEAEGFEAMVKAAESNPAIAIQYKMVDQWKEIAGEQVKAFEHINLGNITVFDGGNGGTSNFLNTFCLLYTSPSPRDA